MKRTMQYEPLSRRHFLPQDKVRVLKQIMAIDPAQKEDVIKNMPIVQLRAMRNRLFDNFDKGIKPRKEVDDVTRRDDKQWCLPGMS